MVQLLVKYGADVHSVKMEMVFDTWSNEIVEFFIEKGADLETGNPLAYALCSRTRPALGIFKNYENRFPNLREQVNIALRHHCKKGNLKWVSLMLWAGADPYAKGLDSTNEPDPDTNSNALELAVLYGHLEVLKLKKMQLDPAHPEAGNLLQNACYTDSSDMMKMLLEKGFVPGDLEDKGSSLIQSLLSIMSCSFSLYEYAWIKENIDTFQSREKVKMIHMVVRSGAKWQPESRSDINNARRSLLKMKPDYLMEFIWIMSEYKACIQEVVTELTKTPTIRSHVTKKVNRFNELIASFHDHLYINSK